MLFVSYFQVFNKCSMKQNLENWNWWCVIFMNAHFARRFLAKWLMSICIMHKHILCCFILYNFILTMFISNLPRCELWLGQMKGGICVWNPEVGSTDYCLNHGQKIAKSSSSCAFLVTQTDTSDNQFVWSYNYPG